MNINKIEITETLYSTLNLLRLQSLSTYEIACKVGPAHPLKSLEFYDIWKPVALAYIG